MESLSNATNASSWALEGARDQQRVTDDLLAAVNESRRLADDAISNAERTLSEAEQTLNTLRGELLLRRKVELQQVEDS